MSKPIRFNAFTMNMVGDQSPGLWTHPRDRCGDYRKLEHWTELATLLERGLFDGVFIADVLGIYDVYGASPVAAIRHAVQVPVNDPAVDRAHDGNRYPEPGLRRYVFAHL